MAAAAAGRLLGTWALLAQLLGLGLLGPDSARALHNVTAELFGSEAWGTVAAFGDFNSDKQTDLFVLRERNDLIIFLADQKEPYFKPKVTLSMKNNKVEEFHGDRNNLQELMQSERSRTKKTLYTETDILWYNRM